MIKIKKEADRNNALHKAMMPKSIELRKKREELAKLGHHFVHTN
jgi:hypothetical protein